jgi:hypothetical protein
VISTCQQHNKKCLNGIEETKGSNPPVELLALLGKAQICGDGDSPTRRPDPTAKLAF